MSEPSVVMKSGAQPRSFQSLDAARQSRAAPVTSLGQYMHMRKATCALLLILASSFSYALNGEERKEFLDSIRPAVELQAGQSIRFKVDKLNIDSEWAVLVGGLLGEEGKRMDWSKAQNCDENLDKMLWVVAQKMAQGWHVKEVYICSPEPPYWNLNPEVAYKRPCGIYAGLDITGSRTAEDECKAYQRKHRVKK